MAIYKDKDELLNTDWQAKINEASAAGDYKLAAQYEQARNDKINSSAYTGKQATTNNYAGWIDGNDYAQTAIDQMASGASAADVLETYQNRLNKATGTVGMDKYVNDEHMQAMLEYIAANANNPSAFQQAEAPTYSYDDSRPTYTSQYDARIDQMLNDILNRDAFSYNAENDPLYQQYRAQYNREGNRAMNDTLAAAAADAGGMNSYAITAAQQANNYYASQLGDKIPELYQLAYEMYLQDIDNQVRDLGLLQEMDNTQYNRYRDTMSDWENDRNFAYNQYRDSMSDYQWDTQFDYGVYRDQVSDKRYDTEWQHQLDREAVEDGRYDTEWGYKVDQDKITNDRNASDTAYDRILDMISLGVMPSDETLAAAGISSAEVAAMVEEVKKQNAGQVVSNPSPGGGGGDPVKVEDEEEYEPKSPGYDNGNLTPTQVRELQNYYDVDADGAWGENSRKAAGGMSAEDAWEEYQRLAGSPKQKRDTFNTSALGSSEAASNVDTLYEIGAVDLDDDGNVIWAKGWNASNWHEKVMDEMNEDIYKKLGLIQ